MGILLSMTVTTIKVDTTVRQRLAQVARARGTTMGALLEAVAEGLEADQCWIEIEAAYTRLQNDDPAGWTDYLAELAEWGAAAADVDDAAAEESPELNR